MRGSKDSSSEVSLSEIVTVLHSVPNHTIMQWWIQDFSLGAGGRRPPTWALFGKNVCENERIGSHRGRAPGTSPRSANTIMCHRDWILDLCGNVAVAWSRDRPLTLFNNRMLVFMIRFMTQLSAK